MQGTSSSNINNSQNQPINSSRTLTNRNDSLKLIKQPKLYPNRLINNSQNFKTSYNDKKQSKKFKKRSLNSVDSFDSPIDPKYSVKKPSKKIIFNNDQKIFDQNNIKKSLIPGKTNNNFKEKKVDQQFLNISNHNNIQNFSNDSKNMLLESISKDSCDSSRSFRAKFSKIKFFVDESDLPKSYNLWNEERHLIRLEKQSEKILPIQESIYEEDSDID